jgi:hypothetical protein
MAARKKKMDAFTARFYAKAGQFDVKPAPKRRHAGVMTILKKDALKEAIRDATKRSKGPRLKGID